MRIGRVERIPELRRFTNGTAVYNISLATSDGWKNNYRKVTIFTY